VAVRVRGGVCFLLPIALMCGCGEPGWSEWRALEAGAPEELQDVAVDSPRMDAGTDASDAPDAPDAPDARDADADDGDDDTAADAAPPVDLGIDRSGDGAAVIDAAFDAANDANAPVDLGVDVPVDRGSVIDVPIDRGSVIDVPIDRGSVIDVPIDRGSVIDVPIDRGSVIDVPIDRGTVIDVPIDRGSVIDVPIDRGSVIDVPIDRGTVVDVPVDRGSVIDVPVDLGSVIDVPVDRGSVIDTGVDVPVDRGSAADTGVPPMDPVAYSGSFAARTGRFTATLTVRGERRSVVLMVPTSANASPPLLMIFHGTNGDGSVAMTEANAQALANSEGVIVAAPSSRWLPNGDFDHATAETYWETAPNADIDNNADLLLVRAIMVEAQRAYGVDPTRIYAMGHSNGAFFAEFVAVLLRDRIAAFSENSGGLVRCARTTSCGFQGSGTTCAALRAQSGYCSCAGAELPVPVPSSGRMPPGLLTHGTRDPLVSVYYTCTLAELMTARGYTQVTQLFNGEGHGVPTNWAQLVWPFFAGRRLGDQ
jgi:poly(3-hydroxybutyrate) depolymerase